MKREGVNRMFPFAIQDISEWDSRYEQKKNNRMVLIRFVGNLRVYQATESSCFIAARVIGAHETLFNL